MSRPKNDKFTKSQLDAINHVHSLDLKLNAEYKKSAYWQKKACEQELIIEDLKIKIQKLAKKGGKNG